VSEALFPWSQNCKQRLIGFKREPDGTMFRHGERSDGSTVEVHISMSPDGVAIGENCAKQFRTFRRSPISLRS
jgi:hypothetical protein